MPTNCFYKLMLSNRDGGGAINITGKAFTIRFKVRDELTLIVREWNFFLWLSLHEKRGQEV